MNFKIRIAEEKDALACHDIYGAYVDGLNVTFTIENPSVEKYREKIVNTKKKYPAVFVKIQKVYIFVMQCPKCIFCIICSIGREKQAIYL